VSIPEQRGCHACKAACSMLFYLAAIVLFFFASGNIAAAQRPRGKEKPYALIFGTVWSPAGQPVYGVRVNIRNKDNKKHHWDLYSDHNGEFALRVPAGAADYVIASSLKDSHLPKDMKLKDAPETTVHIDNDEREDTGLHLQ